MAWPNPLTFPPRRVLRALLAIAWCGIALVTSGCVYLRLLELKHQIAAFEKHFAVQTDDGIRIICLHPVLLMEDVRWIGLVPEQRKQVGNAERWLVRWVKQLPDGVRESGNFDIVVELLFAEGKLTRIGIPERYFSLLPKSFVIDLMRSLGIARVDRGDRTVEAELDVARPKQVAIQQLLGHPTGRSDQGALTVMRYRYVPASGTGLARAAVFDMTITFASDIGRLLRWQGKTPVGRIGFTFERFEAPAAEPPSVTR